MRQLKNSGSAPKLSREQLEELGQSTLDVDSTPSVPVLPTLADGEFVKTPESVMRDARMKWLLGANDRNDTDEVLRLRKLFKDELNNLGGIVKR